jgi:hypothetical protein
MRYISFRNIDELAIGLQELSSKSKETFTYIKVEKKVDDFVMPIVGAYTKKEYWS